MNNLVLIIDDEPFVLEYLTTELTRVGYEVETALTGDDGIHAFRCHKPALVICDMVMPARRGDGLNTVRKIRSLSNSYGEHVKILMMSGGGMTKDSHGWLGMAMDDGNIDDVIQKPIDRYHFIAKINELMGVSMMPGKSCREWALRVT